MVDKSVFQDMEFPTFYHPDCKDDEIFMQFIGEDEKNTETPWESIRFGGAEKDQQNRRIYPVFVKKQEILDAGGILVPVRDDLRNGGIRMPKRIVVDIHVLGSNPEKKEKINQLREWMESHGATWKNVGGGHRISFEKKW